MRTMDPENTSIAAASQVSQKAAASSELIRQNLQVVKDSMVAAEVAEIKSTRQSAIATARYIHDNHWNYR